MIGHFLLEQPVVVQGGRNALSDSSLVPFYKPFDGVVEGYSSSNFREFSGGKFLLYSDVQLNYAFDSFVRLNSWFVNSGLSDSFRFVNVGIPVYEVGYAKPEPTIVTSCVSVGDAFVSETFTNILSSKSSAERLRILSLIIDVNCNPYVFIFNKQKGAIYNLSATRYSLLYRTMYRIWGRESFQFSSIASNDGVLVDNFIELMSAYVVDLSELLVSKGIVPSQDNILALHEFSHCSQSDHGLSNYIVDLGFGRKFFSKVDRWLDLVDRGVNVDFIKSLRLSNVTVAHDEQLDELLDLWQQVPLLWFFKVNMRGPEKV